ncbi:MAG: amidohydrolase [Pirellulales bacterium]
MLAVALAHQTATFAADGPQSGAQAWINTNVKSLVELYQQLHQMPELSQQENKTSAKFADELREAGFQVTTNVGGYGVVGVLKNGAGKTLMLRTDLDALPVAEETGLPYASKVRTKDERGATVGVMHACGHDLHMTNMIGVARYLASHRDDWSGTLVVIGQPAEEKGQGAQAMLDDGLFRRFPRPDFAVALHVGSDLPPGKIEYRGGFSQANVDSVDITIKGRGGHGSAPDTTIDPIVISARLVLDLQTIVSREIKATDPAVITVGSIHGGTKHNIIGDDCHLQLTVRSYSPEVREKLLSAIRRKTMAAAASSGAPDPVIEVSEGTPALFNDLALTERVAAKIKQVLGDENVSEAKPSMGGEDFSQYGLAGVPICMYRLGTVDQQRLDAFEKEGQPPPSLHSPKYYPNAEASLRVSVPVMVAVVENLLPPQKSTAATSTTGE